MYVRNYVLILFFLSNIIYFRSNSNQFITKTAISSSCFKFLNVPFTTNVVHFFIMTQNQRWNKNNKEAQFIVRKLIDGSVNIQEPKHTFFLEDFPDFGAYKKGPFQRNLFDSLSTSVRTYNYGSLAGNNVICFKY